MKRKRVYFKDELDSVIRHQHGNLSPTENESLNNDDERTGGDKPDFMDTIPDSAVLPLGRPAGSRLSYDDEGLLYQVQQAFEEGALDKLSPMQRACFVDVIISGDTYAEVAKRYDITTGAVQTHIKRAAKHIRQAIQ